MGEWGSQGDTAAGSSLSGGRRFPPESCLRLPFPLAPSRRWERGIGEEPAPRSLSSGGGDEGYSDPRRRPLLTHAAGVPSPTGVRRVLPRRLSCKVRENEEISVLRSPRTDGPLCWRYGERLRLRLPGLRTLTRATRLPVLPLRRGVPERAAQSQRGQPRARRYQSPPGRAPVPPWVAQAGSHGLGAGAQGAGQLLATARSPR